MTLRIPCFLGCCALFLIAGCKRAAPAPPPASVVRCAVIGGMTDTEMFVQLGRRFKADTGLSIEIVATGPKDTVAAALRGGEADLVTMHSSDTIVNLVADGFALDPQPWVKNDQIIVGYKDDPAGIRGMTDAVAALRKIAAARTPFVVHSSLGSQEVLRDVCHAGGVDLEDDQLIYSSERRKTAVLQLTDQKRGYTLVGRIPLAGEHVPCGKYGQQTLTKSGLYDDLINGKKIARGQDVRITLSYVEQGEAEAGIVYSTDALISKKVEVVYTFDPKTFDPIVYPLVLLKNGEKNPAAVKFYDHLFSPKGQEVFAKYGFIGIKPEPK